MDLGAADTLRDLLAGDRALWRRSGVVALGQMLVIMTGGIDLSIPGTMASLPTLIVSLVLRYTTSGRRFQVVGANPVAANVVGVRVNTCRIMAYVFAAVLRVGRDCPGGLPASTGASVDPVLLSPTRRRGDRRSLPHGGLGQSLPTFTAGLFLTGLNRDDVDHGSAGRVALPIRRVRPRGGRRPVGVDGVTKVWSKSCENDAGRPEPGRRDPDPMNSDREGGATD